MSNDKEMAPAVEAAAVQEQAVAEQPKKVSADYPGLEDLKQYGGFAFLENIIDGFSNLNPKRKARRAIFMEDEQWKFQRGEVKNRLSLWLDLLQNNEDIASMLDVAKEKGVSAEKKLNADLKLALEKTKPLETAYRHVAHFYENAEEEKIRNITILNVSPEQARDLDNPLFIDHVRNELVQNFDRLDLRKNYGILVVPGHLENNAILTKWSKMAHENKTMLVTDFKDLGSPDDVVDVFENADHTGGDGYLSNAIMTCNYLLGRERVEECGEEDDVFIPPSGALAGRIYNTLMSQVAAGKKFGALDGVYGVRFDLRKSEISHLEAMGLVPMVNEYSKVMAFSAKTLFNGDNLGMQTYSVVRVFDHITKVLFDFLNRRAFENWNVKTEADLRGQIIKWLDQNKGPKGLIQKFKILRLEQDKVNKDRIWLNIHMTPYFPSKSFIINLDGKKGEDSDTIEWNAEYEQQVS